MRIAAGVLLSIVVSLLATSPPRADAEETGSLAGLLYPEVKLDALRARGPAILPELARLYQRSDESQRAVIAYAFYALGLISPEAKRVLLADVHTSNENLRLQVQWALGRVSGDTDVVDVLLDNMQHDDNPLFRDKAACALAHDQIHLSEAQKVHLFDRLIRALRDPKPDVRAIAAKVLEIQTGQSKGFDANAPESAREPTVRAWERWLETYRANL